MNQHPLSSAFPSMHEADFAALCEDIAQHGLRQPVVAYQGEVLDGWHRYRACVAVGEEPKLVELDADVDPVAFVLSLNLSRRHLTGAQRAEAVVRCRAWAPPNVHPTRGEPGSPLTVAEMAEEAGVADRTVQQVKRAHEAGLGDAIRDGKVSAKRAAAIAKLPEAERAAAIEAPAPKRKPAPKPVDDEGEAPEEEDTSAADALHDLAAELELARKIIEADEPLAEAWAEVKTMAAQRDEARELLAQSRRECTALQSELQRIGRQRDALQRKLKAQEAA